MADKALVSPADLRKLLDYNPATGVLVWRARPIELFERRRLGLAWNTRYAGRPALNQIDQGGYRHGTIFGRKVYAHRAALALVNGYWPNKVDHINGDRADNRIENLRDVDHTTNLRNAKLRRDNSSGVCGVFWNTRDGRWEAKIKVNQRDVPLGQFDDIEEAALARKRAEARHGFHENHGRAA